MGSARSFCICVYPLKYLFEEEREWDVAILAVLAVGVGGHSSSVMYGVLPPPTVFPEWKLLTPGQP